MTKPSRKERINQPENPSQGIIEQCKKLREKPQTPEVQEEIKRLRREYFRIMKRPK
jgi:hypothetical protein